MTKNTAAKVVIPAAVWRSSAPRAAPVRPAAVTYRAAPVTGRGASGAVTGTPRWWLLSSAWPRKKDRKLATSETNKMLPAKTASFPHSTGSRRGTAVSDERIIPVPYSPPASSTPSTPTATTAKMTPSRLVVTGLKAAFCAQLKVWYWLAVTPENSAPRPIISTTAASRVHMVDRKERNLVNSESSTRPWVTLSPRTRAGAGAGAAGGRTAVIGLPPPRRHGRHGSRQSRR